MVAADDDGGRDFAVSDEAVDGRAEPCPVAIAQPADAGGQPQEGHLLRGEADPAAEAFILREKFNQLFIYSMNVPRITRNRRPAEGPHAPAEQGPDIGGNETGIQVAAVRLPHVHTRQLRLGAQVVAVIEGHRSLALHLQDSRYVPGDGVQRAAVVFGQVSDAQRIQLGQVADGYVSAQVVRRGLVGHHVGNNAPLHQGRVHLGGVTDQPDGQGLALGAGLVSPGQGLVQVGGHAVAEALGHLALDAFGAHLHVKDHPFVHGHRHRLGAAHAPHPGGEDQLAPQRGDPVVLLGCRQVGLVSALQDTLGADVDPRAGGHLAVHHQARPVQRVELLLGGPAGDQVGVGDDHPRGVGEGFGHVHRPPGLYA